MGWEIPRAGEILQLYKLLCTWLFHHNNLFRLHSYAKVLNYLIIMLSFLKLATHKPNMSMCSLEQFTNLSSKMWRVFWNPNLYCFQWRYVLGGRGECVWVPMHRGRRFRGGARRGRSVIFTIAFLAPCKRVGTKTAPKYLTKEGRKKCYYYETLTMYSTNSF